LILIDKHIILIDPDYQKELLTLLLAFYSIKHGIHHEKNKPTPLWLIFVCCTWF